MLLVVDVGNTQTHLGTFEGEQLLEHWRFATVRSSTADELGAALRNLLALRGMHLEMLDGMIVSSTVPQLRPEYTAMGTQYLDAEVKMVGPGLRTGMPIRYDNPHEIGPDRLVNAVAGYEKVGGPCVVVDFGTAVTYDVVSAGGEYLGGIIFPGVEISMEALTERAAKLPKVDLAEPGGVIGKSTQASIQSGIIYGFAGAIDAIARRLRGELGEETEFIATGGFASAIVPFTETIEEIDDLLTLTGLRLVYERNG
jgi:type III pantothenate kinase